ncbi:MAG: hypothetical protein LBI18_04480 [Planctomycetaceae bacterium]|nr:hypothetical protein [Planctomycetaceae bacterium]
MQIHYALYDQSYSNEGKYWTWFDESLPWSVLDKFYSDFASKHLPPKPNDLTNTDLWGGAVTFDGYLVLYRCFNGGYDNYDRPQRCVIMTAWLKTTDVVAGTDLSQIFDNNIFRFTQEHAKKIPVSKPEKLTEEIMLATNNATKNITFQVDDQVNDLLRMKEKRFVINDVVAQALELLSITLRCSSSRVRSIIVDIEKISTQKQAVVRVKLETPPISPPPQPTPQKTVETPTHPPKLPSWLFSFSRTVIILIIVLLLTTICVSVFRQPLYNKPSLSPQANRVVEQPKKNVGVCGRLQMSSEPPLSERARQVITLFDQLEPAEQRKVLQELQKIKGYLESDSHDQMLPTPKNPNDHSQPSTKPNEYPSNRRNGKKEKM